MIRNGTVEFLIFTYQTGGDGVEVRIDDGTIWLSQKLIGQLFDTTSDNARMHLNNIYTEEELNESSTAKDFFVVQQEGSREVKRTIKHYNLDAIIAVGYRVNSKRATAFRQWATTVLRDFALRGYLIDKKRMENGAFLDEDYFERLLEEIREIRLSERRFYQKITDIYSTAMDYDKDSSITREFFAKVQNKLHYAVHGHTAAELIYDRANAERKHMGLTTWAASPSGKILKGDVSIAKNYLTEAELQDLGLLVNAYLDLAERRARQKAPMLMEDWAKHLDLILQADGNALLQNAGKISAEIAKKHAEDEYEKYRVVQDRLFQSDFDRQMHLFEHEMANALEDTAIVDDTEC
ncbi:MAG: virulence RhuM family protein [Defluviitaleaceae bacterium]|nr:virulence RhuM family protein [Defluviitaleaceae bacterium]